MQMNPKPRSARLDLTTQALILRSVDGPFDRREHSPLPVRGALFSVDGGPVHPSFDQDLVANAIKLMVPWCRIVIASRIIVTKREGEAEDVSSTVLHQMKRKNGETLPFRETTIFVSAALSQAEAIPAVGRVCWEALDIECNPALIREAHDELAANSPVFDGDYPSPRAFRSAAFATYYESACRGMVSSPETVAENLFADAVEGVLGAELATFRDTTKLPRI